MKAVVQILFLLFYLGSAYATGQEKLTWVVQEIQHAHSDDGQPLIGSECKDRNRGLPKFREAKKVNKDFESRPDPDAVLEPTATSRSFTLPAFTFTAQFSLERSSPRAPPALS